MKNINAEISKCNLCHNAKCTKECAKLDPQRIIRAIKFDNESNISALLKDSNPCIDCENPCIKACPKDVDIKKIINYLYTIKEDIPDVNVDISTNICGVKLENPFLLSSSVVGSNYEMCKRAFEAGWAGVVIKTISLMNIHEASPRFSALKDKDNSFLGFKNIEQLSVHSLQEDLNMIKNLKSEYPHKVVIASIMGRNSAEWQYLANKVTKAGADLIELNFSCPNMEEVNTGSDVGQNSKLVMKYTKAARKGTHLPILAKMTPNILDIKAPAIAAKRGGANGISAINTIKCITGVDYETLVPEPQVNGKTCLGGYSGRAVKPIALRFISDLTNEKYLQNMHFSGIGGIYAWKDALDFLLLGCKSLQMSTCVMEYGYRIIDDLILGLECYMKKNNYTKLSDFVGISKDKVIDAKNVERDTILFPKFDYEKCVQCGRCYLSCRDGGHQAISFEESTGKPILNGSKCVGCHLCKLVCPQKAIGLVEKRITKQK